MSGVLNVFIVAFIFILNHEAYAGVRYRFKRSDVTHSAEDEYTLHKCIASVELIRKYRNGEVPNTNSNKQDGLLHMSNGLPLVHAESIINYTPYSIIPQIERDKIKLDSGLQNKIHIASHENDQFHPTYKRARDTPLKTVNIEAVSKDNPPIFMKKIPLPELDHAISSKNTEMIPNVIVIKSSPLA